MVDIGMEVYPVSEKMYLAGFSEQRNDHPSPSRQQSCIGFILLLFSFIMLLDYVNGFILTFPPTEQRQFVLLLTM
jgi:hypothetical protein